MGTVLFVPTLIMPFFILWPGYPELLWVSYKRSRELLRCGGSAPYGAVNHKFFPHDDKFFRYREYGRESRGFPSGPEQMSHAMRGTFVYWVDNCTIASYPPKSAAILLEEPIKPKPILGGRNNEHIKHDNTCWRWI